MKNKSNLPKALSVAGTGAVMWKKPVVDAVSLPVHAQTSCENITGICVQSLDPPNNFPRVIALVDENDKTISSESSNGILVISEENLPALTYRVFGASADERSHTIIVTTVGCSQEVITVTTASTNCTNLVATIELPSGSITPEDGSTPPGEPDHCSGGCR